MNKKVYDGAVYQGIPETMKITGLPRALLYENAKTGAFPHIRSGRRILFNVPALLEELEQQARAVEAGQ